MESGRMPACNTLSLVGVDIASVPSNNPISGDDNHYYPGMQGGNRCGHNKNSFRQPKFHGDHKRRPHAIEEAKRRIGQALDNIYAFPDFTAIFYHPLKAGKGRRRRSESIESAISLSLHTLLHTLNLHRMASGFYDNRNTFRYNNYAYIENQTDQSSVRTKRAMKVLQSYDIIKVNSIREQNNDGTWRTKEVRIEFTDKIFAMLGMMDEFLKDRETIAIKFFEKQSRLDRNKAKNDFYRKTSFKAPSKPFGKKEVGLQSLTQKLTMKPRSVDKGRGELIRDELNNLTRSGVPIQEAMQILKKKFPPPS